MIYDTPHLFLFTVGPVQSFIAQARKTQDLYAGSRILGELIYAASETAKLYQIDFIFPKVIEKEGSIPNRFLGKIPGKPESEMQIIGGQIEQAVRDRFKQLAEKAIVEAKTKRINGFESQIDNHLEINWLFHPIEGEGDEGYRKAYTEIETFMAAVKNIRVFEQYDYNKPKYYGEAGRKCSLDGERNALYFGDGTEGRYAAQGIKLNKGDVRIAQNEGLSAVSLTKRFYEKEGAFPSTAEVAIMNLTSRNKGIFEIYKACLGDHNWDAQLCFKENLTEKYLRKNGYEDVLERAGLNSLLTCCREVFEGKPTSSYYALVAFDADRMGKILSGDAEVYKGDDLQKYQGEVSRLLSAFAKKVIEYFKNKDKGAVAYTGGDDFLGFVNLAELFEVMRWLREEFHQQVSMELSKAGYFKENVDFTFSAGIVIAHYKTPLSIVLDKARDMEKLAKSPKGGYRDAFAISVLKKSGESHETFFRWERADGLKYWTAMERLVGYFEDGYCSDTFARTLAREFSSLQDKNGNITDSGMVKLELSRLVKRSMTEKGKNAGKTKEIQNAVETLMISNKRKEDNFKLELLTQAISIALFLKRNRKKYQPEKNAKTV